MQELEYQDAVSVVVNRAYLTQRKMRNWAKQYRADPTDPNNLPLAREAVCSPSRVKSQMRQLFADMSAELGEQALTQVDAALSAIRGGQVTRASIIAFLDALIVHEAAIYNGVQSGWTLDDVATYIEANIPDNEKYLGQREEPTYVQRWQ